MFANNSVDGNRKGVDCVNKFVGKSMNELKPGLGNWVSDDKFFDRNNELRLFTMHLREGTSLSLVAQRRIGKTSLMHEAARRLGDTVIALHVDLQKAQSPEDALVELSMATRSHESAWRRVASVFGDIVSKVESVRVSEVSITLRSTLSAGNWKEKGDELFGLLAALSDQQKKPVVIFFDEVPILVNQILKGPDDQITPERKATTDAFMSWLRENQLRYKGKVTLVVTGSIGLEPVLGQAGLNGTLNAYHPFELKPWSSEIGADCILALAKARHLPLSIEVARHMINLLGCAIPHHVQLFFDHVHSAYVLEEGSGDVVADFVDVVYDETMTGVRGHAELVHMEERLKLVFNPLQLNLALELLTEAAVIGHVNYEAAIVLSASAKITSDPRNDLLRILSILEHDGYLTKVDLEYRFVSNLVRDWWRKRFGQGYVPILKRRQVIS